MKLAREAAGAARDENASLSGQNQGLHSELAAARASATSANAAVAAARDEKAALAGQIQGLQAEVSSAGPNLLPRLFPRLCPPPACPTVPISPSSPNFLG